MLCVSDGTRTSFNELEEQLPATVNEALSLWRAHCQYFSEAASRRKLKKSYDDRVLYLDGGAEKRKAARKAKV
jgi:hypothetical protein